MRSILLIVLCGVGMLGMQSLRENLSQELQVSVPSLSLHKLPSQLDHMSFVVALGGLKTLTACHLYIQSFEPFEERDWGEVTRLYQTIVFLDPRSTSYWAIGAWHLTHNAYYDYEEKQGMADARRRVMRESFERQGVEFLLKGVRVADASQQLWVQLARLYADESRRIGDVDEAFTCYQQALSCDPVSEQLKREYFYLLSRAGKIDEALAIGRELLKQPENWRFPRLKREFYVLTLLKSPDRMHDRSFLLGGFQHSLPYAYESLVKYKTQVQKAGRETDDLDLIIQSLALQLEGSTSEAQSLNTRKNGVEK